MHALFLTDDCTFDGKTLKKRRLDSNSHWYLFGRSGRFLSPIREPSNRRHDWIGIANKPIYTFYLWCAVLLANCPFYLLAWKRFGRHFAINSAISGALVSIFADHLYLLISLESVNEIYCAVAGGLLMGLGMLILFRHRSSLGGFNVLCLFIQDKFGISVGKSQMAIDACILFASFFFVTPEVIGLSILGAFALNVVLAMNHKPHRYSVTYGS